MRHVARRTLNKIQSRTLVGQELVDANTCGCRNVRNCEGTRHRPGACTGTVATKFWTFRWEYHCQSCREYEWCGAKNTRLYGCAVVDIKTEVVRNKEYR